MSIKAEEFEKVISFIPGLYKFNEAQLFSQAILALTDKELLFYNDHAPDKVEGDVKSYIIKRRIPLDEIDVVVDEKIVKRPELTGLNRLTIVFLNDQEDCHFFYFLENIKAVKEFLKSLKRSRISIVESKVDFSKNN